jgi:hypothetical protein
MGIAAASLDRVIGLVRIRAERRAPLLIAEAGIERAIDDKWPVAQGTISNRGLQVVPRAIETRRRRRLSLGHFRGTADGPRDQHGANQFVHGSPPSESQISHYLAGRLNTMSHGSAKRTDRQIAEAARH